MKTEMTLVHQCRHHVCRCNIHRSSTSSSYSSIDAAANTDSQPSRKPRSFRIVDILTPSTRHYSTTADVKRCHVTGGRDHVTSTQKTTTLSDSEDSGGERSVIDVDDVTSSRTHQLMTSDVSALGRLTRMTYDTADDDEIRHHQRRRHRPGEHHLPVGCIVSICV